MIHKSRSIRLFSETLSPLVLSKITLMTFMGREGVVIQRGKSVVEIFRCI